MDNSVRRLIRRTERGLGRPKPRRQPEPDWEINFFALFSFAMKVLGTLMLIFYMTSVANITLVKVGNAPLNSDPEYSLKIITGIFGLYIIWGTDLFGRSRSFINYRENQEERRRSDEIYY